MPSVKIALAAGLGVVVAALAIVLSHAPVSVVMGNGVTASPGIAVSHGNEVRCQAGETIPQGTTAIRISLAANAGPTVGIRATDGASLITEGQRSAGWGVDETVTVPVTRVARTNDHARVCTTIGAAVERVLINGTRVLGGGVRLRMEYLRPASGSWFSVIPAVARAMSSGHAPSGGWVAYAVLAVMIAVSMLASWLVLTEARARRAPESPAASAGRLDLRRRRLYERRLLVDHHAALPGGGRALALRLRPGPGRNMAAAEPDRFAFSQEELTAMRDLGQTEVQWHPEVKTIFSPAAQLRLQEDLALPLARVGAGAGSAAPEPPLYYALATVPYYLGAGGTLLDQLLLMRLLGALTAGLTALFTFLFVRESLPGVQWAWVVGGLAAALEPLLAATSGAVTPDALLYAVCAAIFYSLARAFRCGLSLGLAVAIGIEVAIGTMTKLNFVGLVPGVMTGLVILAVRARRRADTPARANLALAWLAVAMAIALSPVCVVVLRELAEHRPVLGILPGTIRAAVGRESLVGGLVYVWELYLPRLPGMFNYFPGLSTTRQLWFDRTVGLYGWVDTSFPVWVCGLALVPAGLIALLALRALASRRAALRARLPELLVYLAIGVGTAVLLGETSHINRLSEGAGYAQPRYLLPLLPVACAWVALAARGAGRRWGPIAGALIVVLVLAQNIFSQLLVVARFYG